MQTDRHQNLFGPESEDGIRPAGRIIRAALDTGADALFDYILPEHLGPVQPGQRVQVPFGRSNKLQQAFVVRLIDNPDQAALSRRFKLKTVKAVLDDQPLLDSQLMQLAEWMARYYVCPLGQVLAAMVPAAVKKDAGMRRKTAVYLCQPAGGPEMPASAKQKALAAVLCRQGAVDADSAMDKEALLQAAGCTDAPLKELIRKGIARTVIKEQMHALPAVPAGLTAPSGPIVLNSHQQAALDFIAARIRDNQFSVSLLHGVTGSGKTEVYIRAIEACIAAGRQAIVLLPEIALTAQTVQRFSCRFSRLAVLHSQLSGPQRNAQWRRIRNNEADVVIGARSAVFAPVGNLGLIVVDEEHEASYKQDTVPRYHGRDAAIKRAALANAHCLLGSATPSLETLHNCRTKKHYTLLKLPHRVKNLPMPEMKLVNMLTAFADTEHKKIQLLSPPLKDHLAQVLSRQEQAILLLNRRGYSNFICCPACKHTLTCRNCDVTLTFHKKQQNGGESTTILGRHLTGGYAVCHYCLSKTLVPQHCPLCGSTMTMIGLGSQRLEEELHRQFPKARVRRIDSDAMAGQDYYNILKDFADQKIDILAGTQMLAKGLHFPNVTLVGVISADTALFLPDFRANERTFQLINQVAGRAGRSEKKGTVYVQTFFPKQPAIVYAVQNNFDAFVQDELSHRQACHLPPFWRLAIVAMRDMNYDRLKTAADLTKERIENIMASEKLEMSLRGPLEPAVGRIQRHHRLHLVVQASSPAAIQLLFERMRAMSPIRPAVQTQIDIDPIGVL
ncbi:MAG TPA: primosomal protein N' [Anaerohalosphaeraceae bacterium]|nr:primosomal protein N' [Anaerohalosphaeraceae bacterium]HOM77463.1 primosomal protein N' [Anaerohalosphaeraceae bacterium]HPC64978.1 primosomal protein N' [Anaerohalosphaeraceae bacterium]